MSKKPTEKELRRKIAAAENQAVRQRNYRRARDRALARLAGNHKEEYLELLALEKEKDEQEGKRWHYLAGSSSDIWSDVSAFFTSGEAGADPAEANKGKGNRI